MFRAEHPSLRGVRAVSQDGARHQRVAEERVGASTGESYATHQQHAGYRQTNAQKPPGRQPLPQDQHTHEHYCCGLHCHDEGGAAGGGEYERQVL